MTRNLRIASSSPFAVTTHRTSISNRFNNETLCSLDEHLPCAVAVPPVLLPHPLRSLSTSALYLSPNVLEDKVALVGYQISNAQTHIIGTIGSVTRDGPLHLHPTLVASVFTAVQQQLNSHISLLGCNLAHPFSVPGCSF